MPQSKLSELHICRREFRILYLYIWVSRNQMKADSQLRIHSKKNQMTAALRRLNLGSTTFNDSKHELLGLAVADYRYVYTRFNCQICFLCSWKWFSVSFCLERNKFKTARRTNKNNIWHKHAFSPFTQFLQRWTMTITHTTFMPERSTQKIGNFCENARPLFMLDRENFSVRKTNCFLHPRSLTSDRPEAPR